MTQKINQAMLDALLLVQIGFQNGHVTAKPVMRYDPNATSLEMESLSDIVDAAIAQAATEPRPILTRVQAKAPGWYVLSHNGMTLDAGEDKIAGFCIRARAIGVGARVEEIQHPHHEFTPFGFCYSPTPEECA